MSIVCEKKLILKEVIQFIIERCFSNRKKMLRVIEK